MLHGYYVYEVTVQPTGGFEEVASEDLEPSEELDQPCFEESVEDALSDEHSEVESHMVELFSAEQSTEGFQLQPGRRLQDCLQPLPRCLRDS